MDEAVYFNITINVQNYSQNTKNGTVRHDDGTGIL